MPKKVLCDFNAHEQFYFNKKVNTKKGSYISCCMENGADSNPLISTLSIATFSILPLPHCCSTNPHENHGHATSCAKKLLL
jgi:hypothetical protein